MMILSFNSVKGLPAEEAIKLAELIDAFNYHQSANAKKEKYYEGAVTLGDVNLGIALPNSMKNFEVGCDWGAKTVDVLASRSMFDGFVSQDGQDIEMLIKVMESNNLLSQYIMACRDELKFGCTFATLSADERNGVKVRYHSPMTASALWNGEKGRIDYGFVIVDSVKDEKYKNVWTPSKVNLYTDTDIWELSREKDGDWSAVRHSHKMGMPLMIPMIWNGTSQKPFGRSRIKRAVRSLIDGYIRTIANATIAVEFDTTPQKYLLGITDEQYDAVVNDKFRQYVGSILLATNNPETGERPSFGQLPQGSLNPHIEMIRILATQFSAVTGLSVTDTGVVNDANPTSSDAILAQSQTLVSLAEQLNSSNGDALRLMAQMIMAILTNKSLDELTDEERSVVAHFKNPSMPSVAVTADASIKIASARPEFATTDTFLEMNGFTQADVRRIKAQETRARGRAILEEVE